MNEIFVNSVKIEVPDGSKVKIINGVVYINDECILDTGKTQPIQIHGDKNFSLYCTGNVEVHGNIEGSVTANDITCGNIGGSVKSKNNVSCNDIDGSVKAEGNVVCRTIGGSVKANTVVKK